MVVDPGVPPDDWAVHRLHGRRVARNLEPARRALGLVGHAPGSASDPWLPLRNLDDRDLQAWVAHTVRGAVAFRPSIVLEPGGPDRSRRWERTVLEQGWSAAEARAVPEPGTETDVPAQRETRLDVAPDLLRLLTTGDARRGVLAWVGREASERTGVPAPRVVVRPDPDLPRSAFALRTGLLAEVPQAPWPGAELTTVSAADAADHVALALLEHLLGAAYRVVDGGVTDALLRRVSEDWPQLVHRARRDVGVARLTTLLRTLLREGWGVPCLPAMLKRVVDPVVAPDDGALLAVAREAVAPLSEGSGQRAVGFPMPAVVLELSGEDLSGRSTASDGAGIEGAGIEGAGIDGAGIDGAGIDEAWVDRLRLLLQTEVVDAVPGRGTGMPDLPLLVVDPAVSEVVRRAVAATHPRMTVAAAGSLPPGARIAVIGRLDATPVGGGARSAASV